MHLQRQHEKVSRNESQALQPAALSSKLGSIRWRICALLFFANTINYMDRQVLSVLAPLLQVKIGWSEVQYGYIVVAFQAAYALGLLFVGGFIDKIGVRIGYSLTIVWWSLAAISHAFARTPLAFGIARVFLGFGESGNFPAAIKTVAEWFPKKERALATGIFNSGTSVGAILVPFLVPQIVRHFGWPWAFVMTGAFSFLWLILWWITYKSPEHHPKLRAEEMAHIRSDVAETTITIPWSRVLRYRQTWGLVLGKFLTDPVWWFLLFWLPKYFATAFGLKMDGFALPVMLIYVVAAVGSIFGGWLPALGLKLGLSLRIARRLAMLACALCVLPILTVGSIHSLWQVVAVISLAGAAHQGWSANIYTVASDVFPRAAVASVIGIAGFGGAIGGMITAYVVGLVLETYHSYSGIFIVASLAYITALAILQLMIPPSEQVHFE